MLTSASLISNPIYQKSRGCGLQNCHPFLGVAIKDKVNYHFNQTLMSKIGKALPDKRKLRTYSHFKTVFKFEPYLNTCIIRNKQIRSCFSQFRMSSHDLEIERGRYDSKPKPPEERLRPYCRTLGFSLSEDEVHFLYNKNRNRLFNFVADLYPNVNTLNDRDKFFWYMSLSRK